MARKSPRLPDLVLNNGIYTATVGCSTQGQSDKCMTQTIEPYAIKFIEHVAYKVHGVFVLKLPDGPVKEIVDVATLFLHHPENLTSYSEPQKHSKGAVMKQNREINCKLRERIRTNNFNRGYKLPVTVVKAKLGQGAQHYTVVYPKNKSKQPKDTTFVEFQKDMEEELVTQVNEPFEQLYDVLSNAGQKGQTVQYIRELDGAAFINSAELHDHPVAVFLRSRLSKNPNYTDKPYGLIPGRVTRESANSPVYNPNKRSHKGKERKQRYAHPGIDIGVFYLGYPMSVFAAHVEEKYYGTFNMLLCGLPKIWIIIFPGDKIAFETAMFQEFPHESAV